MAGIDVRHALMGYCPNSSFNPFTRIYACRAGCKVRPIAPADSGFQPMAGSNL